MNIKSSGTNDQAKGRARAHTHKTQQHQQVTKNNIHLLLLYHKNEISRQKQTGNISRTAGGHRPSSTNGSVAMPALLHASKIPSKHSPVSKRSATASDTPPPNPQTPQEVCRRLPWAGQNRDPLPVGDRSPNTKQQQHQHRSTHSPLLPAHRAAKSRPPRRPRGPATT